MDWVEIVGYVASGLTFCTFCMRTMIWLRVVAIASNVAFIVFGFFASIQPVLILHLVMLPLNVYRLVEIRRLIRKVSEASRGDLSMDWLLPAMSKRTLAKGAVLFEKAAPAREMYYLLSGTLYLPELDRSCGPGQLIGEIGVFSPEERRMATAVCATDVEVLRIAKGQVYQLCYQNPALGYHLMQLIIGRLLENQRALGNLQPDLVLGRTL